MDYSVANSTRRPPNSTPTQAEIETETIRKVADFERSSKTSKKGSTGSRGADRARLKASLSVLSSIPLALLVGAFSVVCTLLVYILYRTSSTVSDTLSDTVYALSTAMSLSTATAAAVRATARAQRTVVVVGAGTDTNSRRLVLVTIPIAVTVVATVVLTNCFCVLQAQLD